MKEKDLPLDNNPHSLEELTDQANEIIETLENEKDLSNSIESYQELLKRLKTNKKVLTLLGFQKLLNRKLYTKSLGQLKEKQ